MRACRGGGLLSWFLGAGPAHSRRHCVCPRSHQQWREECQRQRPGGKENQGEAKAWPGGNNVSVLSFPPLRLPALVCVCVCLSVALGVCLHARTRMRGGRERESGSAAATAMGPARARGTLLCSAHPTAASPLKPLLPPSLPPPNGPLGAGWRAPGLWHVSLREVFSLCTWNRVGVGGGACVRTRLGAARAGALPWCPPCPGLARARAPLAVACARGRAEEPPVGQALSALEAQAGGALGASSSAGALRPRREKSVRLWWPPARRCPFLEPHGRTLAKARRVRVSVHPLSCALSRVVFFPPCLWLPSRSPRARTHGTRAAVCAHTRRRTRARDALSTAVSMPWPG